MNLTEFTLNVLLHICFFQNVEISSHKFRHCWLGNHLEIRCHGELFSCSAEGFPLPMRPRQV